MKTANSVHEKIARTGEPPMFPISTKKGMNCNIKSKLMPLSYELLKALRE